MERRRRRKKRRRRPRRKKRWLRSWNLLKEERAEECRDDAFAPVCGS